MECPGNLDLAGLLIGPGGQTVGAGRSHPREPVGEAFRQSILDFGQAMNGPGQKPASVLGGREPLNRHRPGRTTTARVVESLASTAGSPSLARAAVIVNIMDALISSRIIKISSGGRLRLGPGSLRRRKGASMSSAGPLAIRHGFGRQADAVDEMAARASSEAAFGLVLPGPGRQAVDFGHVAVSTVTQGVRCQGLAPAQERPHSQVAEVARDRAALAQSLDLKAVACLRPSPIGHCL